ncbi:hypothetical protein JW872_01635 [Candidatus Babeliales bacterium]|nr:hypothetical protein [Candidatus Babeliales bacterium]
MKETKHAFAEIIDSSLQGFTAQSWKWDSFPAFGSLVTVASNKRILFGIVHQVQTGSMDPTRYPFPYQKTEEELLKEQPQIFEFLKTTFSCLLIGYKEKEAFYYMVSPEPAKIHAFVTPATDTDYRMLAAKTTYLHMLFGAGGILFNLDELLLALLQHLSTRHLLTPAHISSFFDQFSLLTGNDYRRTKLFAHRAQSLLPQQL